MEQLHNMQEADAPAADQEEQAQRILKLFERQLSLPLLGMDQTLQQYSDWLDSRTTHDSPLCRREALGVDAAESVPGNFRKAYSLLEEKYAELEQAIVEGKNDP